MIFDQKIYAMLFLWIFILYLKTSYFRANIILHISTLIYIKMQMTKFSNINNTLTHININNNILITIAKLRPL